MLYETLKELCKNKGIALTALEQELGFGRGSLGKTKSGTMPSAERLKKIADYFGVSVEYLTTGEQPKQYYLNDETTEIAQAIYDDPNLRALFHAARGTKPEEMKLAEDMLKRFRETNPNG